MDPASASKVARSRSLVVRSLMNRAVARESPMGESEHERAHDAMPTDSVANARKLASSDSEAKAASSPPTTLSTVWDLRGAC